MANKCEICGKGTVAGNNVSHSNRRTKRTWKPNLQTKTVSTKGGNKKITICTRCLRTQKVLTAS